jgi:hypothetical protein
MRRRRRSSVVSARRRNGRMPLFLIGIAAVALIGSVTYFAHVADSATPPKHEIRVELSNALGN